MLNTKWMKNIFVLKLSRGKKKWQVETFQIVLVWRYHTCETGIHRIELVWWCEILMWILFCTLLVDRNVSKVGKAYSSKTKN